MLKSFTLLAVMWLIFSTASAALAQTQPSEGSTIADFERGNVRVIDGAGAKSAVSPDAAQGGHCLRIEVPAKDAGWKYVQFDVPPGVSFAGRARLSAQLHLANTTDDGPAEMIWETLDANGNTLLARGFTLMAGNDWVKHDEPLEAWRWNDHVGDWDEVRTLRLWMPGKNVSRVDLDDIRLDGTASPDDRKKLLLEAAFEKRPRKVATRDGSLVATDAVDVYSADDLEPVLRNMVNARKYLRRIFADGVHPTDTITSPAMCFIFEDEPAREDFIHRLGEAWRIEVISSKSDGRTFHDIATAVHLKEWGTIQPVYLHECVHAIVTRDLRLLPGSGEQGLLQEAIATYLQFTMYPADEWAAAYVKGFSQPVDRNAVFTPLHELLARSATHGDYGQLASLYAYLVERDEALLRALVEGVAAGRTISDVLADRKTSVTSLEEAWFAWGQERFKTEPAQGEPIFKRPIEFR